MVSESRDNIIIEYQALKMLKCKILYKIAPKSRTMIFRNRSKMTAKGVNFWTRGQSPRPMLLHHNHAAVTYLEALVALADLSALQVEASTIYHVQCTLFAVDELDVFGLVFGHDAEWCIGCWCRTLVPCTEWSDGDRRLGPPELALRDEVNIDLVGELRVGALHL